jgi:hypothetical protein
MFESSATLTRLPTTDQSWRTKLISKQSKQPRNASFESNSFIGEYIRSHGNEKFWNLADSGKERLQPLKDDVKSFLEAHNENLKERESCTILIELFMIGKSEEDAHPALFIMCAKKGPRKRVGKMIQESKILDKYNGVFLVATSQDPRYGGTVQSIASGPADQNPHLLPNDRRKVYKKRSDSELTAGQLIYIALEEYEPKDTTGRERRFRMATIGGFFNLSYVDGTTVAVGMTVAHAFETLKRVDDLRAVFNTSDDSDESDFEFEFVGPNPEGSSTGESDTFTKISKF